MKKLKSANSNAKLVFTTIAGACADLISDGKARQISTGRHSAVKVTDLDVSDPIQKAIKQAMKDNGSEIGYVCWEISSNYKPVYAQWSNSNERGVVGQYPNPETEPGENHFLGAMF